MITNIFSRRTALALVLMALALCGCKPKKKPLDITGSWYLVSADMKTKSVDVGPEVSADVYIKFAGNNKFDIYQKMSDDIYRHFDGKWTLAGTKLDGTYSDGKKFGSPYTVEKSKNDLTLTSTYSGDIYVYEKATIPDDVIKNAR